MKIKVFSHMNDMGAGMDITRSQIKKIIDSGLIDVAEFYFVTNYDPNNYTWLKEELKNRPNVNFLDLKAKPEEWEMPTLNELKRQCDNDNEESYVLYIHHKGAHYQGKDNFQFVTEWRELMEYFNIEKWKDCVAALSTHDTAGMNYRRTPWLHYSGNFWWARSSYIKKLPNIKRPTEVGMDRSQFGNYTNGWLYRFDAEAWIGMAKHTYFNFYTSGVSHYRVGYPARLYRDDMK